MGVGEPEVPRIGRARRMRMRSVSRKRASGHQVLFGKSIRPHPSDWIKAIRRPLEDCVCCCLLDSKIKVDDAGTRRVLNMMSANSWRPRHVVRQPEPRPGRRVLHNYYLVCCLKSRMVRMVRQVRHFATQGGGPRPTFVTKCTLPYRSPKVQGNVWKACLESRKTSFALFMSVPR